MKPAGLARSLSRDAFRFAVPLLSAAFLLSTQALTTALAADGQRGEQLYQSCAKCHGSQAQGLESANAPRLSHLAGWDFRTQVLKLKKRQRGYDDPPGSGLKSGGEQADQMHRDLKNISRSEISDMYAFISACKPATILPPKDGNVAAGRELFGSQCARCHGSHAEGRRFLGAPKLAGQHDWYLRNQIASFRLGLRGSHPDDPSGKIMRQHAPLDEQETRDILAYITSLKP